MISIAASALRGRVPDKAQGAGDSDAGDGRGATSLALPQLAARLLVSACAILALRWELPVFRATVRGDGVVDATVGAFLAAFALGVVGLPGFLTAVWNERVAGRDPFRGWVRAALVMTLASGLTTATWILVSVSAIGSTLSADEVLAALAPIVVTLVASIYLRVRVACVTRA